MKLARTLFVIEAVTALVFGVGLGIGVMSGGVALMAFIDPEMFAFVPRHLGLSAYMGKVSAYTIGMSVIGIIISVATSTVREEVEERPFRPMTVRLWLGSPFSLDR